MQAEGYQIRAFNTLYEALRAEGGEVNILERQPEEKRESVASLVMRVTAHPPTIIQDCVPKKGRPTVTTTLSLDDGTLTASYKGQQYTEAASIGPLMVTLLTNAHHANLITYL